MPVSRKRHKQLRPASDRSSGAGRRRSRAGRLFQERLVDEIVTRAGCGCLGAVSCAGGLIMIGVLR